MNEILTAAIGYAVPVIEACGALIIAVEVVRTMIGYVANLFRHDSGYVSTLCHRWGRSMVMGLVDGAGTANARTGCAGG